MYTIEIYDPATTSTTDITNKVKAFTITKVLNSTLTQFKIEAQNVTGENLFKHLYIKEDGTTIIAGYVVEQSTRNNQTVQNNVFMCQDWGFLLSRRIVAEIYANKTPDFIIKDAISKAAPEFTTTNVRTSTINVEDAIFQYNSLSDVITNVAEMATDWHYYIDVDKDFHFFNQFETTISNVTISDVLINTLEINYIGYENFNRIWIVGTKQAADNAIDVYFTSDGVQRYFGPLPYEPSSLAIYLKPIGLPEFPLTIAEEKDDDGSSNELLYNTDDRVFYFPSYRDPALFTGGLKANFKPVQQFIEYFENSAAIEKYGLFEKAIKNQNVTDRLEARRIGKAEVKKLSAIKRIISFETESLLSVQVGERALIQLSDYNVNAFFLLRRITKTVVNQHTRSFLEWEEL